MTTEQKIPFWAGSPCQVLEPVGVRHLLARGAFHEHRETAPLDGLDLAEETDEEYVRTYIRFL